MVGVVGLGAVEGQRDVPVVWVGPAGFGAECVADRAQGGDEVLADLGWWDDCGEQASHGLKGTLENNV